MCSLCSSVFTFLPLSFNTKKLCYGPSITGNFIFLSESSVSVEAAVLTNFLSLVILNSFKSIKSNYCIFFLGSYEFKFSAVLEFVIIICCLFSVAFF